MKDRDEIIKSAHQYARAGRIDDAIAAYLKILPYSVDGNIHNRIGHLYLKKSATQDAIKYFREAASIFNKEESHAKAIALYHKILFINPDQLDVVIALAELNAERGFTKLAIQELTKAAEAYHAKGLPMKALSIFKKALAVCPSDTELKIKMADLHFETKHTERALKMYLAIAMEYEANAESVKAEEMYKKITELDPDNIESLAHLSRLAEDDQDLELAFEYLSKAAAIAPHNSDIMFDFSNLAAKTNKDISEYLLNVQNGNNHQVSQDNQVPDAVNNCNHADHVSEPIDLSSENNNSNVDAVEQIPASTSPLPMPATGSASEHTGFTLPHDTGEPETGKKGIWEDMYYEDKNNSSSINSITGKNLEAANGHATAEADYDHTNGEYNSGLSLKKPDHEKLEKDSRRLKKRVKRNGLHVLLILFFVIITVLSFFFTFKLMKHSQTVDIETPKHIKHQELPAKTEVNTTGVSSDTANTAVENKAENQAETVTPVIEKKDNIREDPQGESDMPVSETGPDAAINEINKDADNIEEMDLNQESSIPAAAEIEVVTSPMKPDSEIAEEKEDPHMNDSDEPAITETTDEIQQEADHTNEGTAILSFNESFDNNDNKWDVIQTSAAYVRLLNGTYHIQNRRESGAYIILNGPDISTDHAFEIETHLRSVNLSEDHSFGLVFGAKDRGDFYVFQMLSENEYSIKKYYKSVPIELAEGRTVIQPDSQDLFTVLKISSKENKFSFFINDTLVDEITDISFSGGKTGFLVNGKSEIVVDNLLIHKQPG